MPTVPVYTRSVSPSGPSVNPAGLPSVRQSPDAPVAAFGASDLSSGQAVVNDAVKSVAQDALNKANQLAVLDAENKLSKFQTDIQYGPDGAMTKKGKQVFGLYDSVKEKWDKGTTDISSTLNNDDQRIAFSKIQSNYWQSLDANIQRHTAEQIKQYDTETTESALKNMRTNAALNFFDPKQVSDNIARQHATLVDFANRSGLPESWVESKTKDAISETHVEVVKSMLLNDQDKTARGYFEKHKDQIDPTKALALDATIDGKMIYDTVQQVSIVADKMRLDNGQIDRARVSDYIKSLNLKPEDAYKVTQHVEHLAAVDSSQLAQQRTDAERSFVNELIQAQSSGVTYDQALKIPSKYGWDNASTAQMQAEVTKIYTSPIEKFNSWLTREPQDVQSAWAETVNQVKAKYGNATGDVGGVQQKLADAAINELKQSVLGKNADQIREITAAKLKNVVVSPGMIFGSWWPNTAPAWKADAGTRRALSEAYSLLEKDYGLDTVGQARSWLATHGKPVTPANVKQLIDSKINKLNEIPQ